MNFNVKSKISIIIAICFGVVAANAQTLIDEDMLDNIEENAKILWSDNTPAFASNTVPEKYKEESAVIFGYKRNVTIDKKSRTGFFTKGEKSLLFFENVHFKIKVNDKSSVKTFTEVYFRYRDKEDGFSAKVIKPDGIATTVVLAEAVAVESTANMPEFYKSFFDQESGDQARYFKVAIPDLQTGDILEYVAITQSKLNVNYDGYIEFSPTYELCNKGYPVLFNQIGIELDNKSYFKSVALNGAPEFKKETSNDPEFYRYVFTDIDRSVEKNINFINTLQTYPMNKFQVIYANNSSKAKGALIGQIGEIKSGFTKEELCLKAWESFENMGDKPYGALGYTVDNFIRDIWPGLVKNGAKKWSEKEFIEKIYYKLRNSTLGYGENFIDDKQFSYIFTTLLNKRDIKSELIITTPNNVCILKDILFDEEILYCVLVNNTIYYKPTEHSNPGELGQLFQGNSGYLINKPSHNIQSITDFKFPNTTFSDNIATFDFTCYLNNDLSSLFVSRQSTYKGISKINNINNALIYTPYTWIDHKYYYDEDYFEKLNSKDQEYYNKVLITLKEKFIDLKPDFVKAQLQKEYDFSVKYNNFSVESDGRSLKKPDLIFTEDFELGGMVRKAGKKYLVNVAGLVGSQLQIKKEERVRKYDINVGYAKSYFWTINFKVPDGYTAEGMNELATEVTNETGTYAAKAEEKNGIVTIKIKKIYKKANVSKDKWQDMLAFIDAAYNNSFKYILLKPKN